METPFDLGVFLLKINMRIKRINKIRDVGILQNFDYSKLDSPYFNDINLIFGWNGTGKTTLSRVLRCYELGKVCLKLQKYLSMGCDIELVNGARLSQADFAIKQEIRVFNKDFIEENIFQSLYQDGENIKAFYYLGNEKIELIKERKEKDNKEKEIEDIRQEFKIKTKERDRFAQSIAKNIKDIFLGIKEFQHYDKNDFIKSFNYLKESASIGVDLKTLKISQKDFEEKLKIIKNFEILESWIKDIENTLRILNLDYIDSFINILERKISIQNSIDKLKTDGVLSNWVQQGITIHKNRNSVNCEFCGQKLIDKRMEELESHFNKDYIEFVGLIDKKIQELKDLKIGESEKITNEKIKEIVKSLNRLINKLILKIEVRQKNILKVQSVDQETKKVFIDEFNNINISIEEIKKEIFNDPKELELSLVLDNFDEYDKKNDILVKLIKNGKNLKLEIEKLNERIKSGEKSVKDFKLPAKEINETLEKFLGHSDLKFEAKKDDQKEVCYEIKRNEEIAYNLSEGEKTAISLIYFLKKLDEDDFKLSEGLVFIDDPISSMDSNFLYSAYALIVSTIEEEKTKNLRVGQFFLSTHNYDFLNLFKKEYKGKKTNLYMFRIEIDAIKGRCSNIYKLDKLLNNFDSDYQYLYSLLIKFEKGTPKEQEDLALIYPYPNISRRVLEVFLSFKFPAKTDFQCKINAINEAEITKDVKQSVYRFTNIESHGSIKEMEGFSPGVLEPSAKKHILDVLKIMRALDSVHCSEMESSISKVNS